MSKVGTKKKYKKAVMKSERKEEQGGERVSKGEAK